MNIRIFQSFKGDCLLIESEEGGKRILCDGGTPAAMKTFIAKQLEDIETIDLIYVSHIDQDHIGGVLTLLEAAYEWKTFNVLSNSGDPPRNPQVPRAPAIKGLWHNSFRDLIKDNHGTIENLLAASAPALQASVVPDMVKLGREYAQIAASIPEALKVSRLAKSDLLDIPLNRLASTPSASKKLLMARKNQKSETFGSLQVTIIGPSEDELEALRKGWDEWLRDPKNRKTAHNIRDQYANSLSGPISAGVNPLDLRDWNGVPEYEGVTAPNVASLVLLVEEGESSLLLTGDSHPKMILDGLEAAGRIDDGFIHLDVLKFPHHGSEHNMTREFGNTVSADHYIFCGNGEHTNPEITVLDQVLQSRVGGASVRARSPEAEERPFKFWFNTTSDTQTNKSARAHMQKVERWAEKTQNAHPLVFQVGFISSDFADLRIV